MLRYIVKRVLLLALVIIGVSFLVYVVLSFAPGDPATQILGYDASPEALEALRQEMGLNDPLLVRYFRYMLNFIRGDLGYSYQYREKVSTLYFQRIGATFVLAFSAIFVAIVLSLPLGIYAALHKGSVLDNVLSATSVIGLAAPNFWVGLLLLIAFSLKHRWFPSGGFTSFKSIVLPAITLGTGQVAVLARTTRSSMLDVLNQDYLLLARSKGVSEKSITWKHCLKNTLIPIITVTGSQIAANFGGSVVTEGVFSWPGVGNLMVDAIKARDIETVTGFLIMTSIITSVILLIVDILYAFVDPRIKSQYSKK